MRCALVTGGSRGIGRAICIRLAKEGFYVLINYKSNKTEADRTLSLINEEFGNGELLPFDVADKQAIKSTLDNWIETNPEKKIEVLVNNAGIKEDALMNWMNDEQWDNIIRTNLDSFFYVTRIVLTQMLAKKWGRIINVVSLSALKGLPGQTNYSAAKAGVIGATKSLAQEVARYGITANAVAPGFIKTDMIEGLDEKELSKMIPAKRFGLPEEVAHAVSFFVSKEAAYITAQVLSINGGLYS
ncbi:MAG: 3-oxoacyl-ACP reductase FabG [Bacteroidota bacterium]|nr:3-oxoacyl-ACP reductase FabG [Bacteroidota bacterium]